MSQEFYRNGNGAVITNTSLNDGKGTIYQLRNINSVKLRQHDVPWMKSVVFKVLWGLFGMPFAILISGLAGPVGSLVTSIVLVSWLAYSIYKDITSPKTIYVLTLSTSSGEIDSFSSVNKADVLELAEALNSALSSQNAA